MKTLFLLLALLVTVGQFESVARADDAVHAAAGMPLYSADGRSLGSIYKVLADGSVKLIIDGRMVTVAAASLRQDHGAITTSLTRSEVHDLR